MKTKRFSAILMCLILSLVMCVFCSCATPSAQSDPSTPEPAPSQEPASEPEAKPVQPTDAEIEALYKKADEAYMWFDMGSCPVAEGERYSADDVHTYALADNGFSSTDELRAYLNTLFSSELTDKLMSGENPTFIDHDGKLYVAEAARGANILAGDTRYEVVREDERVIYRVSVDQLEEPDSDKVVSVETYDMVLQNTDAGWVFTEFSATR